MGVPRIGWQAGAWSHMVWKKESVVKRHKVRTGLALRVTEPEPQSCRSHSPDVSLALEPVKLRGFKRNGGTRGVRSQLLASQILGPGVIPSAITGCYPSLSHQQPPSFFFLIYSLRSFSLNNCTISKLQYWCCWFDSSQVSSRLSKYQNKDSKLQGYKPVLLGGCFPIP